VGPLGQAYVPTLAFSKPSVCGHEERGVVVTTEDVSESEAAGSVTVWSSQWRSSRCRRARGSSFSESGESCQGFCVAAQEEGFAEAVAG
jgi:hypothetical protein